MLASAGGQIDDFHVDSGLLAGGVLAFQVAAGRDVVADDDTGDAWRAVHEIVAKAMLDVGFDV